MGWPAPFAVLFHPWGRHPGVHLSIKIGDTCGGVLPVLGTGPAEPSTPAPRSALPGGTDLIDAETGAQGHQSRALGHAPFCAPWLLMG